MASAILLISCAEMNRLRALGYEPVLVSGSLAEIVRPVADALAIRHILATNLMRSGDHYNGRIIAPQTIGQARRARWRRSLSASRPGRRTARRWTTTAPISRCWNWWAARSP